MSINKELYSTESTVVAKSYNDISVIFDDPVDGIELFSQDMIVEMTFHEDIFSLLPFVTFTVLNKGNEFNEADSKLTACIGRTIYVRYTPKIPHDYKNEHTPPAYIKTKLVIQSIRQIHNPRSSDHAWSFICVYDALQTFSNICPYPKRDENAAMLQYTEPETSTSVIRNVLASGGLNCQVDVTSFDSMQWINSRQKIYKFVNKVLAHSWIDETDAMLVYTSFAGRALHRADEEDNDKKDYYEAGTHCTSCAKLMDQTPTVTYCSQTMHKVSDDTNTLFYTRLQLLEDGGITTLADAYTQEAVVYRPDISNLLDFSLQNPFEFEVADSNVPIIIPPRYVSEVKRTKYANAGVMLGSNPGKIDSLYDCVNEKRDGGIHFAETHEHYDVAPNHNKAVISSFFNTAIIMQIDYNTVEYDVLEKQLLPKIGQMVYLDCSSDEANKNLGYTGNYIVAGVTVEMRANGYKRQQGAIVTVKLMSSGTYMK